VSASLFALWAAHAAAAPPVRANEALSIAKAFAPRLVFHPNERYFPISPLFPVDPQRQVWLGDAALAELLATPQARQSEYDHLSRDEQLSRASLAYRVFSVVVSGRSQTVVEYWCHYVFNDYQFHGWAFPWQALDNHYNDLERVFIVLERRADSSEPVSDMATARRAFVIRRIIGSAHDGAVSANVFDVPLDRFVRPPVTVLVEKGSHAMAPDVDDDGRVTFDVDVNGKAKSFWGIRDHGESSARYRPSFTDDRTGGIRMCEVEEAAGSDDCAPYSLEPAEPLRAWFNGSALKGAARDRTVGRTPWTVRWFGDEKIERLLVAPDGPDARTLSRLAQHSAVAERGFSIGTTFDRAQPVELGGRYSWVTPGHLTPDLIGSAYVVGGPQGYAGSGLSLLGYYPLDIVTKVVFGVAWSDPRHLIDRREWDVPLGVEFRVGHFRVRPDTTLRTGFYGTTISMVF
jgi:hypothetical protein